MDIFSFSLLLKMCWNTYFIVFFEHQPKFAKNGPKNDNFSHFAKHRFIKTPFCCNPPCDQKLVFLNLGFLKPKTMMLNKNITLNQQKNEDKKKGFQREKKTGNQKRENIDEGQLCNWIFWCCSFHETKAKKKEKERQRQKQGSKIKQKRKTGRKGKKDKKKKRETEKEILKKGEAKKS